MEEPTTTKRRRGGPQPNSGRPKGSTNKISGATILASIEKTVGKKFEDCLAEGYLNARLRGDNSLTMQYEKMFLSKVVADKTELDVTSDGKPLQAVFKFTAQELDDWKPTE
jgi:hypothetical protein